MLSAPRVADEQPPDALQALLTRAGLDWTQESAVRPVRVVSCPGGDGWLPAWFRQALLDLARRVNVDEPVQRELARRLVEVNLTGGRAAATTAAMTIDPRPGTPGLAFTAAVPLPRRQACDVLAAYLAPLTGWNGYVGWLREMATSQAFWRGGRSGSPRVPEAVRRRERENDAELLDRWFGAPPAQPALPPGATERARTEAERRFRRELRRYRSRRAEAEAFLRSEPAAPGIAVPLDATRAEERQLGARQRAAAAQVYPLVVLWGNLAPANLFISEAATPLAGYLNLLEPVLHTAVPEAHLRASVLAVAYGLLALALVPVSCLYDRVHGTCVVETLLPRLAESRVVGQRFVRTELPTVLLGQLAPDERAQAQPRLGTALEAVAEFADQLGAGVEQASRRLLAAAVAESGGRIRTPQRFTARGRWTVTTSERSRLGGVAVRRRRVPEMVVYGADRDADAEIFWVLRSLWAPLGTAAALINQAGMRFWINAADNRWGGRHPPHVTHRLGNSIDFDIGFAWRPQGHQVPAVRQRDPFGRFLDEAEPGVRAKVDCLQGMNRVAGWIGVQAFILAGVSSYLYGDWGLIEEAGLHLSSLIDIQRPGTLFGREDPRGHADHWHFDMVVGDRPFGAPADPDPEAFPYVWQATTPKLFDRLWELAAVRNRDAAFYRRIAGLADAPLSTQALEALRDGEDWIGWARWQNSGGDTGPGLALLPVWNPALAEQTRGPRSCAIPRLAPEPLSRPDALPG